MSRREHLLCWLLRLTGVAQLGAVVAIVLPTAWMSTLHEWTGLGPLPTAPIVSYLTRSISALYAIHGLLLLVIATDLRRFRPIVVAVGVVHLLFGVAMVGIDRHAGMPLAWTLGEGPVIIAAGCATLWLVRAVPRATAPPPPP